MRKFWRALGSIFFWSYDRGTVPYDLLVIAIVLFVFLSPRRWFHDQPDAGVPTQGSSVLCQEDAAAGKLRCRVAAQLLSPPQISPQLQEKAHEVLRANAAELKGRTFQIDQIQPVLGTDGGVLYYEVSVKH